MLNKKNELTKSSKSLTKSIVSRSNSKESAAVANAFQQQQKQRSRTCSQTNSANAIASSIGNQSPTNFKKVVQIFTTSQMMGKHIFLIIITRIRIT